MRTMDIWYARLSEQDLMSAIERCGTLRRRARRRRQVKSARSRRRRKIAAEGAHARQPAGAVEARPSSSTVSTGSSASRRSSSRCVTVEAVTASRPTRSSEWSHDQFRAYRETLAG